MSTFLRGLRARVPFDRAAASSEDGFTLIEVLVAALIALAVIIPVTAVLVTTQNHAGGVITRADQIQVDSVGLRSMDQELRQAYELEFPVSSTPTTGTPPTACPVITGAQACNQIDILERLGSADYEVRYDCTVSSTTVPGDRSCVRYLCNASATTPIGSLCPSALVPLVSSRVVIDALVNGTNTDPVFSMCYPSSSGTGCAAGATTRATSATVTIKAPSTPNQAASNGGDPSTITLTDGVYFPNLDFSQ